MVMLSGGGVLTVLVEDSADSSPREGASNCLAKCGLEPEHQRTLEMGGISFERLVDGDRIRWVQIVYNDQVGMSLHPTVRLEEPPSRKAK
jgi:hypothetical protein